MTDTDEEQRIHQMLDLLRARYEEAAKPYVDRLVELHRLKLWNFRVDITRAEAEAMGFTVVGHTQPELLDPTPLMKSLLLREVERD